MRSFSEYCADDRHEQFELEHNLDLPHVSRTAVKILQIVRENQSDMLNPESRTTLKGTL